MIHPLLCTLHRKFAARSTRKYLLAWQPLLRSMVAFRRFIPSANIFIMFYLFDSRMLQKSFWFDKLDAFVVYLVTPK
uniref:Uncharacterized protein n=1 Tax=Ascaris lumbricoides TaxID=6252 RepID=A0A9J2PH06_ASCLU